MAIGSALPAYSLCWWLNQSFDFNFIRQPDMDVCFMEGKSSVPKLAGGLFEALEEPSFTEIHFPVYKHDLPFYEASVFLYTNTIANKKLLPELKFADYLILIQFASYIEPERNVYKDLALIPDISWVREIDLDSLKNKRNLIV